MAETLNLNTLYSSLIDEEEDGIQLTDSGEGTISSPVTGNPDDKLSVIKPVVDPNQIPRISDPDPILVPEFQLDPEYVIKQEKINALQSAIDLVVNVVDDVYVKTPDIRNINYPSELRGGDFLGFDIDFTISYESVNTTYVRVQVGDSDDVIISNQANGTLKFNVEDLFRRFPEFEGAYRNDQDKVPIPFKLTPVNTSGRQEVLGKTETFIVNFDKGDFSIPRSVAINRIAEGFKSQLDQNDDVFDVSKYLTHLLHLGDGDNKVIANWTGTKDSEGNSSLVVKMYEPLPTTVQTNDKVWISKLQSEPIVETVTITGVDEDYCPPLQGANFSLDPDTGIGFEIYDDLIASGSETSTDLVNEYANSIGIDTEKLNINYVSGSNYDFDNFVHYGSATERIKNFYYKVQLLEAYDTEIAKLPTGSNVNVTLQKDRIKDKKNTLIQNFDGFETYLYEESGSLTYPKSGSTLLNSTGSQALNWYNGGVSSASEFDKNNVHYLVNNLPRHVIRDKDNEEFLLFMDMIGQHFDTLWVYINGLTRVKKLENKVDEGITNDLVYYMLESLGWETEQAYDSQFLWEYAFGKYKDGTQKYDRPLKSASQEVWRRILNNLPYLLKHKGTKRSLKAILSCYGVPQSLLTIMEFGGPTDPNRDNVTQFSFEDVTAAARFNGAQEIQVPWNQEGPDFPGTIEMNVKFDSEKDHQLIGNLPSDSFRIDAIQTTGSLGYVRFQTEVSESVSQSMQTPEIRLFNDTYKNISLTHEFNNLTSSFNLYVNEATDERIRTSVSASVVVAGDSLYRRSSIIKIGETLSGSIDEFRLWRTPLEQKTIFNHTRIPDAIDGSHISSSTEDLWFRLDFERPKNLNTNTDILNVAISDVYGETYATASGFPSITEYPYNYTTYTRTVSARIPSTGYGFSNKIRFEKQDLVSDLSHKVRATKKAFDRAPVDSPRLGLFFSINKEINLDIVRSIGDFNIDNYIGAPSDRYNDEYEGLKTLRDYYFQRITRNYQEYIQLVRYIDKSLFDTLENLVPTRAKLSKGLLIEPHILERAKVKWDRPESLRGDYDTSIDTREVIDIISELDDIQGVLFYDDEAEMIAEYSVFEGIIDEGDEIKLDFEYNSYTASINYNDNTSIIGTTPFYEVNIDAPVGRQLEILGRIQDLSDFTQVGFDLQDGFGLFASASHAKVTTVDALGNRTGSRKQIYLIREEYTDQVYTQVAGYPTTTTEENVEYEYVDVTKERVKITIQDFGATPPSVGGSVIEVTPLDGYFPTHYKFVSNVPEGLQRSYYKGSKQTANTTPDGLPPVQTFTTNPNILRTAEAGRGSGEPILIVD